VIGKPQKLLNNTSDMHPVFKKLTCTYYAEKKPTCQCRKDFCSWTSSNATALALLVGTGLTETSRAAVRTAASSVFVQCTATVPGLPKT